MKRTKPVISITFEHDVLEAIDRKAERLNVSRSSIVSTLLKGALSGTDPQDVERLLNLNMKRIDRTMTGMDNHITVMAELLVSFATLFLQYNPRIEDDDDRREAAKAADERADALLRLVSRRIAQDGGIFHRLAQPIDTPENAEVEEISDDSTDHA